MILQNPILKQQPNRIVRISHTTQGFLNDLTPEEQIQAIREFEELAAEKEDWFYGVLRDETGHPRVFIEQNETGAYTALMNYEH